MYTHAINHYQTAGRAELDGVAYVDLFNEIYEFVGGMPEEMWFTDETMAEFGNPVGLIGSAMDYLLTNLEDPEEFMRITPEHFQPSNNEPWDVFYLKVVYRLANEIAPHLIETNREVCDFTLEQGGVLVVRMKGKPDRPNFYESRVEPPRSQ